MTDTNFSLTSFQQAFTARTISPRLARYNRDLYALEDTAQGELRVTHARIRGHEVLGIVMYCLVDPVDGVPCLQVGYAVTESHRRKGIGMNLVRDSLAELDEELKKVGILDYYIEAVAGLDNVASSRIAERLIYSESKRIIDGPSKLPALQYLKRVSHKNEKEGA